MLFLPNDEEWVVDGGGNEYEDVKEAMDLIEHFSDGPGQVPTPLTGPSIASQFAEDFDKTEEVHTSYGGGH